MNILPTMSRTRASQMPSFRYLTSQHTTSQPQPRHLNTQSTSTPALSIATISRTGTMKSTIQLSLPTRTLNPTLQTHSLKTTHLLAHDPFPAGYLREGDVVEYSRWSGSEAAEREAKKAAVEARLIDKGVIKTHTRKGRERDLKKIGVKRGGPGWVVRRVVTPFGVGLEERGSGNV